MKRITVVRRLIIICLCSSVWLRAPAESGTSKSRLGRCDYYGALSDELGCADEGYLRAFGERYCRAFESAEARFSEAGRKTLVGIRLCLQLELEKHRERLDCKIVKGIARQTHLDCYKRHGFCGMEYWEMAQTLQIVAPALDDPEWRAAIADIAVACGKRFSY